MMSVASLNHGAQQQQQQQEDDNTNNPFVWNKDDKIVVLPGDNVSKYIDFEKTKKKKKSVKIGNGLEYTTTSSGNIVVKATLAGRLQYRSSSHTYYVQTLSMKKTRYIPREKDMVLVTVEERVGMEYYKCTILNSVFPAVLAQVDGFDGATKRNKPNYTPGTLVYCRISYVCPDWSMDPQLSCKSTPPKDWMTDECSYGELKGGTVLTNLSTDTCRDLLQPDCVVLDALSHYPIPFEMAVGINGTIWIHSNQPEHTILICNAIQNSQILPNEQQCRGMVKSLMKTLKQKEEEDQYE